MKKTETSVADAEAFVRKALSRFGKKVASEKSIKAAAKKISKAVPVYATSPKEKEREFA